MFQFSCPRDMVSEGSMWNIDEPCNLPTRFTILHPPHRLRDPPTSKPQDLVAFSGYNSTPSVKKKKKKIKYDKMAFTNGAGIDYIVFGLFLLSLIGFEWIR